MQFNLIFHFLNSIKDIENLNKTDAEITDKYINQYYSDELRLRIKETKLGNTDYSLLHLAAKNLRKRFCLYLMHEIKIGDFKIKIFS